MIDWRSLQMIVKAQLLLNQVRN